MVAEQLEKLAPSNAAKVTNRDGSSPFVFVCDHASNFVPPQYGTLGLDASDLTRHIAWDPGALPVVQQPQVVVLESGQRKDIQGLHREAL